MRTAGRVCWLLQTARRQVSGQGGSDRTPRAGRGRSGARGEGRGRELQGPERPGPKSSCTARREEGGRPFPSSTAPGSAAAHTSVVLTPICPGNGTSRRTGADAESAAGWFGARCVHDPCGVGGGGRPRNKGSCGREGVTSWMAKQRRRTAATRERQAETSGAMPREEGENGLPEPAKNQASRHPGPQKHRPSNPGTRRARRCPGSSAVEMQPFSILASPVTYGRPASLPHCATDPPCASSRRPGFQTREAAEHHSKLRLRVA